VSYGNNRREPLGWFADCVRRVREGLVYVAMTMRDLRKYLDPPLHARTSDAHPLALHRRSRERRGRHSPEQLTLSDALRDPEVNAALNERESRYARDADSFHDLTHIGFGHLFPSNDSAGLNSYCYPQSAGGTSAESPSSLPEMRFPTAVLTDEGPGPEEATPAEVLHYRMRRLEIAARRTNMDDWGRMQRSSIVADLTSAVDGFRPSTFITRHDISDPSTPSPERTPIPGSSLEDRLSVGEESGDANVTCARFLMLPGQFKIAIKFEPEISGRFILLKLWANRRNVDVQSVIVKGYAGPRYFSAQSVR
jgi:hypothetical protein